jgi:hypothetical protein
MAPSFSSPPTGASPSGTDFADSESPVWRLESIPGKGKGLIATRDISPGTLILSEEPLITTDVIKSIETTEQDLAAALKALPKDSQRAYLSLHNNYPGKNPLSNIVRSNGYPLGPNSDVGGVFPTVSRINHSCRPNSKHTWNPALHQQTVYAIRPIPAGQELSLSYLQGGTSSERQQELQSSFGFTCRCELCALSSPALRASDARIRRAQHLHDAIGDGRACRLHPRRVVADGRALRALYAEEGVEDDRVPNVYWDMFQVCNMHGDVARASAFAREYCALKRVSEGPRSAAVEEVAAWVEDPATHESYGQTKELATRLADIPTGVSREEYEKWLWREN